MPHIRFEKAEGAYRYRRLGHLTTVLHGVAGTLHHIFHQISLCVNYLLVQLPPLELYKEYYRNAHAGANIGHQLLLPNFTECLGMSLGNTLLICTVPIPFLYTWCYLGSRTLTFATRTQLAGCDVNV